MADSPILAIVVPCYNEAAVLPTTATRLAELLASLVNDRQVGPGSFICFVDDGSLDATWEVIANLSGASNVFRGVKLSRNFGHQNALMAGLTSINADAIVTIDADLQDDVTVIAEMVAHFRAGKDVVFGVRHDRTSDTLFKRATAASFYRLLRALGVHLVDNHADFRLISRKALDWLRQYDEVNLFLRGLVSGLTNNVAKVEYVRTPRLAGKSKYPIGRMLSLAWEGITSSSIIPLRLTLIMGLVSALFATVLAFWTLKIKLFGGAIPGWASTLLPLAAFSAVQLLALAILAEYLAKTFMETKRRPRFLIEKTVGKE